MSRLPLSTSGFDGKLPNSPDSDVVCISDMMPEEVPRPSAADPCATIVQGLMRFNVSEDVEFARKACESLVKKKKEDREELNVLIRAIFSRGEDARECITIAKTLDGRLQVAGRKGFPHSTYAGVFRWPNLHKNDLKHLPICQNGFDLKKEQVCINPYHYERVENANRDRSLDHVRVKALHQKKMDHSMNGIRWPPPIAPPLRPPLFMQQRPQQMPGHIRPIPAMNFKHPLPPILPVPPKVKPPTQPALPNLQQVIPEKTEQTNGNTNGNRRIDEIAKKLLNSKNGGKVRNSYEPPNAKNFQDWATLTYYRTTIRISQFQAPTTSIFIGNSLPEAVDKWSLGGPQGMRGKEMSNFIGKGIRLSQKDNGDVWLEVRSHRPVYVQSQYLDRESGRSAGDVNHKIYPGGITKIFDMMKCRQIMSDELKSPQLINNIRKKIEEDDRIDVEGDETPNQRELREIKAHLMHHCVVRFSFGQGWGPDYDDRITITDCACWIDIQLNRARQFLELVIEKYEKDKTEQMISN